MAAVAVVFVVTRDDAEGPGSTSSCFVLAFEPRPTPGRSFAASVQTRDGCDDPGEMLGGHYLELREGDRRVAYLQTPDKVFPPDNTSFNSAGALVERPLTFKLPELDDGRYTLCSTFSTEARTNLQACGTFEIQ